MIDIKEQTFENAKTLKDKKLLSLIFTEYLGTEGMSLQELADEYEVSIGVDGDGDRFVAIILQDKVIIQVCEDKNNGTLLLGAYIVVLQKTGKLKGEETFMGTYFKLPSEEEVAMSLMN